MSKKAKEEQLMDENLEINKELLRIARMNCEHEFEGEMNTEKGHSLELQATYTCKKCHGYIYFYPYDKELSYHGR